MNSNVVRLDDYRRRRERERELNLWPLLPVAFVATFWLSLGMAIWGISE